jgi:hypothetical protein
MQKPINKSATFKQKFLASQKLVRKSQRVRDMVNQSNYVPKKSWLSFKQRLFEKSFTKPDLQRLLFQICFKS